MKFVDPKNDVAFRKIFGDEKKTFILISFLNAVLKLENKEDKIKSVEIVNPFQLPRIKDLKESILDVRAVDNSNREFIVEMQVENKPYMSKRVLYYTSKSYISNIKKSESYMNLRPIIFIGILDFTMFDNKDYLSKFLITNAETNTHEFKDFELNFIELPKFKKEEEELETIIDKWVYFIKNAENIEMIPQNVDDKGLLEAYQTAQEYMWSEKELDLYDYMGMRKTDKLLELQFAQEKGFKSGLKEGIEKGVEKGREEGREEGLKEGIEKGEYKKSIETAKNLLSMGLTIEQISKATGLSLDDIERLNY